MFLRHPMLPKVMTQDFSVISISCCTFPSPDWYHKRYNITKYQKAHDRDFIEAISFSFILGSMCPVSERKKAPTNPVKLAKNKCLHPNHGQKIWLGCKNHPCYVCWHGEAIEPILVSKSVKMWIITTLSLSKGPMFIMSDSWVTWSPSAVPMKEWCWVGLHC